MQADRPTPHEELHRHDRRSGGISPADIPADIAQPSRRYPAVPAHPSFPALEREVLDFWAADRTFQASVDGRPAGDDGGNEFVFYDGPPFANGLPHYGHLLTGYVKDVAGEQVAAVVRQPVGQRRAVVEDELVAAVVAGRGARRRRNLEGPLIAQKSGSSRSRAGKDGCAGTAG